MPCASTVSHTSILLKDTDYNISMPPGPASSATRSNISTPAFGRRFIRNMHLMHSITAEARVHTGAEFPDVRRLTGSHCPHHTPRPSQSDELGHENQHCYTRVWTAHHPRHAPTHTLSSPSPAPHPARRTPSTPQPLWPLSTGRFAHRARSTSTTTTTNNICVPACRVPSASAFPLPLLPLPFPSIPPPPLLAFSLPPPPPPPSPALRFCPCPNACQEVTTCLHIWIYGAPWLRGCVAVSCSLTHSLTQALSPCASVRGECGWPVNVCSPGEGRGEIERK